MRLGLVAALIVALVSGTAAAQTSMERQRAMKTYNKAWQFLTAEAWPEAAKTFQEAMFTQGIPITAFEVDDIDQEFKRLKKLGVAFTPAIGSAQPDSASSVHSRGARVRVTCCAASVATASATIDAAIRRRISPVDYS